MTAVEVSTSQAPQVVSQVIPDSLPVEFIATLFSRIDVSGADDCWEWTAGKVRAGYGAIYLPRRKGERKRQVPAHRLICTLFHGQPEPDEFALHSCDNPPCCNPHHLRWGTHLENVRDAVSRGRMRFHIATFNASDANRGVNNPNAKLDEEKVREIRRLLADGESVSSIARDFGVWSNSIRQIRDGQTWKHVQ